MDHYATLGVSRDASKAEIKEAFRRSALRFHPDRHALSPRHLRDAAALRFRQASEAYQVLADDLKRAHYDRLAARPSSAYSHPYRSSSYGGYGYGGGSGGYRPPPPPLRHGGMGFDLELVFRHLTRRGFLVSVAFASALLGGAMVVERSVEAIWKMNNSGKSFEEAMESMEKVKEQKENS